MLTIQPQYLPLSKLLAGRIFDIPEYQRAYSWGTQQRQDLFNDIEQVHSKGVNEGHFMSAIVCLQRGKQILGTDEFTMLDVVDGQQRLTTLIILLQAIKLELNANENKEIKLRGELGDLLVKPESDHLLLLQTNHDSSRYFSDFIRDGKTSSSKNAKTLADKEILKAIEEARKFVTDWKDQGRTLLQLLALLKNRLFFLLHETIDEKSVYTVFEVLNSRGLDVSWMDRFKSIIMGSAFELTNVGSPNLIKELHTTWRDIYSVIGLRQGMNTESLRFAATLRQGLIPSKLLSEENAVQELRSETQTAKEIREVASWLLSVVKACDKVTEDRCINNVTRISQARFLATAIHLRDDIPNKERQDLLLLWEKISFRIYGMFGKDARVRVGEYVRLAWQITNNKLSVDDITEGLQEIGKDFPIGQAIECLKGKNCYEGWEDELRYFMFRREEHLAKVQRLNYSAAKWREIWMESPARSIEHIRPQRDTLLSSEHRHRLGNLMLLTPQLNSKLGGIKPKDKLADYRKTGLLVAGEVADAVDKQPSWGVTAIKAREDELLQWAKIEWAD